MNMKLSLSFLLFIGVYSQASLALDTCKVGLKKEVTLGKKEFAKAVKEVLYPNYEGVPEILSEADAFKIASQACSNLKSELKKNEDLISDSFYCEKLVMPKDGKPRLPKGYSYIDNDTKGVAREIQPYAKASWCAPVPKSDSDTAPFSAPPAPAPTITR
jgi:hypothetical protein